MCKYKQLYALFGEKQHLLSSRKAKRWSLTVDSFFFVVFFLAYTCIYMVIFKFWFHYKNWIYSIIKIRWSFSPVIDFEQF